MPPKRAPAPAHARIGARAAAAASAAAPALYSFAGLLAALMAAVRMLLGWVVMEAKDKVRGRVAHVDARPFFLQGAPPVQGARRARGFYPLGTPSAGRLCPLSLMQSAQKPRKVVLQPVERGTEREHWHAGAGQRRRRECFMRLRAGRPGRSSRSARTLSLALACSRTLTRPSPLSLSLSPPLQIPKPKKKAPASRQPTSKKPAGGAAGGGSPPKKKAEPPLAVPAPKAAPALPTANGGSPSRTTRTTLAAGQ